jgi:uncharacterized protein YeeX (DUF496 family)
MSPQKKVHADRKRFIAIFKTRYAQSFDLEYTKSITPAEGKLINQVNKELLKNGFTADDYLKWIFDDFFIDNDNLGVPTAKSICSQWFLHTFLNANREIKEARKRQELDKKAGLDLIQRARGLIRCDMESKDVKKVSESMKDYGERRIMLSEFRKVVETLESTYRKK